MGRAGRRRGARCVQAVPGNHEVRPEYSRKNPWCRIRQRVAACAHTRPGLLPDVFRRPWPRRDRRLRRGVLRRSVARDGRVSGDWLTPHYNYEVRFQKPILFYWLVAIAYKAAGVGEAAARFPVGAGRARPGHPHLPRRTALVRRGHRVLCRDGGRHQLRLLLDRAPVAAGPAAGVLHRGGDVGPHRRHRLPHCHDHDPGRAAPALARVRRRDDGPRAAHQGPRGRGPARAGGAAGLVEGAPEPRRRRRRPAPRACVDLLLVGGLALARGGALVPRDGRPPRPRRTSTASSSARTSNGSPPIATTSHAPSGSTCPSCSAA